MSRTSYSFCLWETNGRASERAFEADPTTLFHSIFGVKTPVSSVLSEADRTPDGVKKRLESTERGDIGSRKKHVIVLLSQSDWCVLIINNQMIVTVSIETIARRDSVSIMTRSTRIPIDTPAPNHRVCEEIA